MSQNPFDLILMRPNPETPDLTRSLEENGIITGWLQVTSPIRAAEAYGQS